MSIATSTRCTLVVQPTGTEGRLPAEWRLLWVTDSCEVDLVPISSQASCQEDIAEITSTQGSRTVADFAGNSITASFCSAGEDPALSAQYVLDLPGSCRGRLKVVALDPSDPESTRVVQSEPVTFNGGVETAFPSVILRAVTLHQSTEFRLEVFGAGLGSTGEVALAAPNGSWRHPLAVETQNDESITATASLAANVPACIVEAVGENQQVAMEPIAGDPPPPMPLLSDPPEGCEFKMREVWPDHDPYLIQPKDFAFVPGGWTSAGTYAFHIFYIRKNQYLPSQFTEKNIGHAVSDSLSGWAIIDTSAIKVRASRFDSKHVWAPNIVRKGLTYHMFYTGVDAAGDQRIGLATSTDLVNWTQGDSLLEVGPSIPWADPSPDSLYGGAAQLRDPFVMEDPNAPGEWLMYFVTVAQQYSPEMVVGVARSDGDFSAWGGAFPLWNTHRAWPNPLNTPPTAYAVESPHAFKRNGSWWLLSTVNGDSVWATANVANPSDTVTTNWSQVQKLTTLVPPLQAANLYYWHATEYLQISEANDIEYLAAFNDANVCVSITQMRPTSSPYLFSMGCPSVTSVSDEVALVASPRLLLAGMLPARSRVGLRIELPARTRVKLAVFDVTGRRVRTVTDEELPAGVTEVTWDARDANGAGVGSGVYFASLTTAGTRRTVRVPLIR